MEPEVKMRTLIRIVIVIALLYVTFNAIGYYYLIERASQNYDTLHQSSPQ